MHRCAAVDSCWLSRVRILLCLVFYVILHFFVLESDQGEKISNEATFDFEIELRIGVQRRAQVYLEKPRFEILIDEDVET